MRKSDAPFLPSSEQHSSERSSESQRDTGAGSQRPLCPVARSQFGEMRPGLLRAHSPASPQIAVSNPDRLAPLIVLLPTTTPRARSPARHRAKGLQRLPLNKHISLTALANVTPQSSPHVLREHHKPSPYLTHTRILRFAKSMGCIHPWTRVKVGVKFNSNMRITSRVSGHP